jgi:anti-sigma factor RsiW
MTMDCAQTRKLIDGYVDSEIDATTTVGVEEHLEGCEDCRREAQRVETVRLHVRQSAPYHAAPPALVESVRRLGGRSSGRAPVRDTGSWWAWLRPVALVAVTAAVTWLAASHYQAAPSEDIAGQVIAGHARATLTTHLADVSSSAKHTVKPWLSSKLDFSPPVADLGQAGFPLVGGRLDYIERRPVAVLVYKRRDHVIDLFVWPQGDAGDGPIRSVPTKIGYQVLHWTGGGMTYWAVSDLNGPELKTFADTFREQTAPQVR